MAQLGVLGAIVLALIFFVLRPMTGAAAGARARRADRAARARRRRAPRRGAADRQRQPARPAGADRQQDRAAARRHLQPRRGQRRGAPELDRSRPTPARSLPDHERLSASRPSRRPRGRGRGRRRSSAASRRRGRRPIPRASSPGRPTATEAFLEEQGRLTSELVEAIDDARLTNEAARRHVAASLAPMVEALAGAIAPALADAGLGAEIARWSSGR